MICRFSVVADSLLMWRWLNSTTCWELVTEPIEYETKSNNIGVVDQPSQPVVELIVPVVIAAKDDVMAPLFIIVVQHYFCSIAQPDRVIFMCP